MNHRTTETYPEACLHHDKTTDTAFIDILPRPNGRIDVMDVTDLLDLGTTVLARVDEDGNLIGLTIENYNRFKREVMRKYWALKVDRIIGLLVERVRVAG